jgi:hypothetical protein
LGDPGIPKALIYAVCTDCSFLRAYSRKAENTPPLEACPACGGELLIRESEGRFPPAYVSRIGLRLMAEPALGGKRARRRR